MFFAISSYSEEMDTESAFAEIKEKCLEKLDGRQPLAGLLFASIDMEHQELVDAINETWPGIQLIGCSTDGELSSEGFNEDSVSLMLFGSDVVDFSAGIGRNISHNIADACQNAKKEALSKTKLTPSFCIITPESLTASLHQVVMALKNVLGDNVPFFGATAGDQWQFKGTYQYYCNEVLTDALPLLLFSGDIIFSAGVASGWQKVGEPGEVTRSEGPVVYEIDSAPAIEFYKRFLGKDAVPSGEVPLAILNSNGDMQCLRATPGTLDNETGAITYFADVPIGTKVQITVADRDGIIDGCRASIETAFSNYPSGKKPEAGIIFSCSARKLLLGTRTKNEYELLIDKLGNDFQLTGFYGYGEIGPSLSSSGALEFHNETFVSLLIGT